MHVLGSIVIDILVTLVIILFRTVLFALASPGPPDLFDKAKEALHACPPRAVPLIQAQTTALSQRVCEGVRSVSQRAQLRKISERERERARQRRRGREGGVRGERQIAVSWRGWVKYQSSLVHPSPLRNPCVEGSSAVQLNGSLCMLACTCR